MATEPDPNRPAPGALALVQEFLNTQVTEPSQAELELAEQMRREHARGLTQATIAAQHGVSQQLVSAVLRGKRLNDPSELHLGSPAAAAEWLRAHGWFRNGEQLATADHQRLVDLHAGLLAMTLANNGGPLGAEARAALARAARPATIRVGIGETGNIELRHPERGADAAIGALLLAVHEGQADGTWQRLKACPADHCQHVFYDTSRNRTATWCSMAICGNRTKVRAYQQRRRGAEADN